MWVALLHVGCELHLLNARVCTLGALEWARVGVKAHVDAEPLLAPKHLFAVGAFECRLFVHTHVVV